MFLGTFYHKLEENGRVSIPSKFRSKNTTWVLTRGLDGCLFMFNKNTFEQEISTISSSTLTKKTNRDLARLFANQAQEVDIDEQGRIKIPKNLLDLSKLTKNVVIVGSFSRIEIWDQDHYHQYLEKINQDAEEIAEKID